MWLNSVRTKHSNMKLSLKYMISFLMIHSDVFGVYAVRKDDFQYIYNFVAELWDNSEHALEYFGKIQAIFCPEQPICYENNNSVRSNILKTVPSEVFMGNDTINVENIRGYTGVCCLPCFCSDDCLEDNNRCLTKMFAFATSTEHDKVVHKSVNKTLGEHSIRSECIGASVENYFKKSKYPRSIARYYMVTQCFIDRSNEFVVSKCENPTYSRFDETIPVTSNSTERIYWNKYCAVCNNDSTNLLIWNSTAFSKRLLFYVNTSAHTDFPNRLDDLKTFDNLHQRLSSVGNIIFTPPIDMARKRCFQKEQMLTCKENPINITSKNNISFYAAFTQLHSPVYFIGITRVTAYMNVFSLFCREHTLRGNIQNGTECPAQEHNKVIPGAMTTILDYSSIGDRLNSLPYEHDLQRMKCSCDEFEDPYKGFCRPLFCPFGELLIACRCVQPIKSISGMPVLLKLKVTVKTGTHLLSTDTRINKLHTAVIKFLKDIVKQVSVMLVAILRPVTNETDYYICLVVVETNYGYDTKETLKPLLGHLDSPGYKEISVTKITFNVRLTHKVHVWTHSLSGTRSFSFSGVDLQDHCDLKPEYLNEIAMKGPTRNGFYQIFSPLLYCNQVQLNRNESVEENGMLTINVTTPSLTVWDYHRITPNEVRICLNEYVQLRNRATPKPLVYLLFLFSLYMCLKEVDLVF